MKNPSRQAVAMSIPEFIHAAFVGGGFKRVFDGGEGAEEVQRGGFLCERFQALQDALRAW